MQRYSSRSAKNVQESAFRSGGFTLIELLVVVAIIAVLVAILLPTMKAARDRAKLVVCGSQERQILNGVIMYAQEMNNLPCYNWMNQGVYNAAWTMVYLGGAFGEDSRELWRLFCPRYFADFNILYCPADTCYYPCRSQGWNAAPGSGSARASNYITWFARPDAAGATAPRVMDADHVFLFDNTFYQDIFVKETFVFANHGGAFMLSTVFQNQAFGDGHVETLQAEQKRYIRYSWLQGVFVVQ